MTFLCLDRFVSLKILEDHYIPLNFPLLQLYFGGHHIKAYMTSGHKAIVIVKNPATPTVQSTLCLEADDVDGASDGISDIDGANESDGLDEGMAVGDSVGDSDGTSDGATDGVDVGTGVTVGLIDGLKDGANDGAMDNDGEPVG